MQPSPVLFANALNSFGALLWLILGGAIIWWLIWLLLKADESDRDLVFDQPASTSGIDDDSKAAVAAPAEAATLVSGPPSQAFTMWTQPRSASGDKVAPETPDAPSVVDGPPSQAFTIWT